MLDTLKYIASSPPRENGGFHPQTIAAAKWALETIIHFAIEMKKKDETIKALTDALDESGLDLSPCRMCGMPVACVPDGLPMCKKCAEVCAATLPGPGRDH